jgi:hypothetical protein
MTLCIPSPTTSTRPYFSSQSWTEPSFDSPLAKAQLGTGFRLREDLKQASTNSLEEAWKLWMSSSRTNWDLIPEEVLEKIETEELEVDQKSIQVLQQAALSARHYSSTADAAVRLLGILLEEGLCESRVRLFLTFLLNHPDASRRYHAVKALWQCRSIQSVKAIRQMMLHETHSVVAQAAEQASTVLEHYVIS